MKYVEEEHWVQVDVPYTLQQQMDLVVRAAVSDDAIRQLDKPLPTANGGETNGHVPGKTLQVEGQTFCLVHATAKTLEMLEDYLKLVVNLELITTDIMAKIIELVKVIQSVSRDLLCFTSRSNADSSFGPSSFSIRGSLKWYLVRVPCAPPA